MPFGRTMLPAPEENRRLKKPLLIDTRFILPLPKAMWGMSCGGCDRTCANWQVMSPKMDEEGKVIGTENPAPICALCFLYESGWGERNVDDIEDLIADVERKDGYKMLRTAVGRLMSPKDGNKILGAVCLVSKMREMEIVKRVQATQAAIESGAAEGDDKK